MGNKKPDIILSASGLYDYGARRVDLRDKDKMVSYYVRKWLIEAQSMLEFDGLPDTIPQRDFVRLLQTHGYVVIPDPVKYTHGKPYVFYAGLGGVPNVYYMPTISTIANPALGLSITPEIHKDCVVIPHDSYYMGLLPIFNHYATLAVEADLSLYISAILSRAPVHISAQGDRSKASADQYLNDLEIGKIGAIFEDGFLDGIKSVPGSSSQSNQAITNLIELRQYIKASRFNEIGLNANYNMKRESINSAEAQMDDDALLPYTQDVIRTIQTGLDEANEKFGLNMHVRLGGVWADRERKQEAEVKQMEKEAEEISEGSEGDQNVDETESV